jgi:hypothetical protein
MKSKLQLEKISSDIQAAIATLRTAKPRNLKAAQELEALDLSISTTEDMEQVIALVNDLQFVLPIDKKKYDAKRTKSNFEGFEFLHIMEMLISDEYRKIYEVLVKHFAEDLRLLFPCEVSLE